MRMHRIYSMYHNIFQMRYFDIHIDCQSLCSTHSNQQQNLSVVFECVIFISILVTNSIAITPFVFQLPVFIFVEGANAYTNNDQHGEKK